MSARRVRRILGILILLLSLALLAWGFWPVGYENLSVPIPPDSMQLPTPTSLMMGGLML